MNKGSVEGETVFGISQRVESSTNIVSMGVINSTTTTTTNVLWEQVTGECTNIFVFDKVCDDSSTQCGNEAGCVLFEQNSETNLFVTTQGQQVNEVLNNEISQHDGWMLWAADLELVDELTFVVEFDTFDISANADAGQTMKEVAAKENVDTTEFVLVKCNSEEVIDDTTKVMSNMCVMLCHRVEFEGEASGVWFVEHNGTLYSNSHIAELLNNGAETQVWLNKDTQEVVNGITLVESDMVITVSNINQTPSSSTTSSSSPTNSPSTSTNSPSSTSPSSDSSTSGSSSSRSTSIAFSGNYNVVIVFDDPEIKTKANETSEEKLAQMIEVFVGKKVSVVIEQDIQGFITRVIVNVEDEATANIIKSAITSFNTDDTSHSGECILGVLCRSKNVYVEMVDGASLVRCDARVIFISVITSLFYTHMKQQ